MPEAKHSPGPWLWIFRVVEGFSLEDANGNRIALAVLNTNGTCELEVPNSYDMGLIEAAPDMLEALEAIAPLFENLGDEWWCPSCGATECSYDYRCTKCGLPIADCQPSPEYGPTILKAIAKAKGETYAQES